MHHSNLECRSLGNRDFVLRRFDLACEALLAPNASLLFVAHAVTAARKHQQVLRIEAWLHLLCRKEVALCLLVSRLGGRCEECGCEMALGPRELCHFEAPHAEQVAAGRVGGRERHCQLEVLGDGEGALDLRARAFKRRGRAEQDAAPLVRGAAVRLHQHGAPRVRQPVPHEALLCARLRLGFRQLVQRARLAPEQLGVVGALGERSAHERLQLDVPVLIEQRIGFRVYPGISTGEPRRTICASGCPGDEA
mmetsp:Transcript_37135/g.81617  ORF Transcript_37135/g.81617 Transcript_37135/m.81617 type:complete len:251 (+) Transcript_37135:622-1374(+)